MKIVTVEEVQARLPELLHQLEQGEGFTIVAAGKPVGRLLPAPPPIGMPVLGRGSGKLTVHSDDDDHLADFARYMP